MQERTHVNETETSSLWSDQRTTPCETLSSQDSLPFTLSGLVRAEEVSDFATSDTDITGWDVGIGTNVLAQFAHEGNAEFADFIVGFALWVKIGSSFSTSHVHYEPKD